MQILNLRITDLWGEKTSLKVVQEKGADLRNCGNEWSLWNSKQ